MSALARPSLRRAPLVAGAASCTALLAALLAGPGGWAVPAISLGLVAAGALGLELARRTRSLVRSARGPQLVLGGLASLAVVIAWSFAVAVHAEFYAGGLVLILVGTSIAAVPFLDARRRPRGPGTPWQRLARPGGGVAGSRALLRLFGPVLAGLVLVLLGLRLLWQTFLVPGPADGAVPAASLVFTVFVLTVIAGRALVDRGRRSHESASVAAAPNRDAQVIAAHLHDSVLQTLALIQRRSHDPVAVAQLARQQERSLRAWLAGRDERSADTLAGALRAAAREVEDEHAGAVIEVVTVGDARLGSRSDAVVRAAREAMRNAVRHGGGGTPTRVFLEVEGDRCEAYVRDAGGGFSLDAVAEERRGVRDAIIGRMEHAGGTATIESGPAGTEVALRIELPAAGPAR